MTSGVACSIHAGGSAILRRMSRRRRSLEQQERRAAKRVQSRGRQWRADQVIRALATPPTPGEGWEMLIHDISLQIIREIRLRMDRQLVSDTLDAVLCPTSARESMLAQDRPTAERALAPSGSAAAAAAPRPR